MTVLMAELHPAWFLRLMAGLDGKSAGSAAHPLTDAVPAWDGVVVAAEGRVTSHTNCGKFNKIGVKT